ncbi:MAG: hypothetical protein HDT13_12935 [Butyrivibrio sp.]|nr:hypothetical protein [Butyrivibrio sp.]
MKIKLLMICFFVVIMLSGCSGKTDMQNDSTSVVAQETTLSLGEMNVQYMDMYADWPAYKNADELLNAGNIVVIGKVTGISFQVLDMQTGLPPTEDSEQRYCCLHAIYDVEVNTSYKGNTDGKLQFAVEGGIKEKYLEEQLAAIAGYDEEKIPVMAGMPEKNIGDTYLFVLYQYEDAIPTLVNPEQGIYKIDDPLEKDIYSYVSPKEIISYFGEDEWTAFISEYDSAE